MSDILYAHGYNRTSVQLSSDEIQNILPAMLLPMVNLACNRQPPSAKFYSTSYGNFEIVLKTFFHFI